MIPHKVFTSFTLVKCLQCSCIVKRHHGAYKAKFQFCSKIHRREWLVQYNKVRFWSFVEKRGNKRCWGWKGRIQRCGYSYYLTDKASRYIYALINGPIPKGKHILHSCDNKVCVNPKHLRAGTHKDNIKDAIERRRYEHGERHHNAKLTDEDVTLIRKRCRAGVPQCNMAKLFKVDQSLISRICNKHYWVHI